MEATSESSPRSGQKKPGLSRPRKAKACQRCRTRKQRCEGPPNCQNCASANEECIPAERERMALYSVQYIESLEARISDLQHGATLATPGMSLDQSIDGPSRHIDDPQITNGFLNPPSGSDQPEMTFMAPLDNSNNTIYGLDILQSDDNLFSVSDLANHDTSTNSQSDLAMPIHVLGRGSAPTFAEVSLHEGAVFFNVYFETIHPRYPFLDIEECSRGYQDWRMGEISLSSTDVWRCYLVKMAREAVSPSSQPRTLSNLDGSTRQQHHNLMLQAQADRTILTDHSYKPLVRLQAMLLHAIHAMHGESTPRLGHIIGVAMRFAVMKGFHRLVRDGTAETDMAITAWWCIYMLDKVVAVTLGIPPYPPEEWITTPAYVDRLEPRYIMPWSSDVPGATTGSTYNFNLSYYAHMCRIRQIHSKILSATQTMAPEARAEFTKDTRAAIDQWSHDGQMYGYGRVNTDGYASSLGLTHVAAITRVILYRLDPADIDSPYIDEKLQACCDFVGTFRALQKKRQIPKHWGDVRVTSSRFARHQNVDRAIRDLASSLAIFADRSEKADVYRDCLDVLANGISRSCTPGTIDEESRREISGMVQQIIECGIAPDVASMLSEMSQALGDG
ncbi:uncharacterized protein NECHADRAFT_89214 [Fusarium vanettenii 77-13-4]|uniref:Zn(2)-C6 fungal-type domain-containing protein n=1 Tax=Fusarium vanettenii (strain ATCC MYA-4622 / CBS 123669 / FGSC 9596 / NRRL 45880 / 77-13-4) TaxID=660122 RepID=C7ZQI8_FUSV7|nr:uncharacterized protein NECHADRAFT_89214 [Fusarium vanettenii 77-13-4]EEU33727.1 predicted protein [Fusarium vanettenii 77-13-4]